MSRARAAVELGTSKARLLAGVDQIRRQLEALPEPACRVLEEARVLDAIHRHLGTVGHLVTVLGPAAEAIANVGRAVNGLRRAVPRRR